MIKIVSTEMIVDFLLSEQEEKRLHGIEIVRTLSKKAFENIYELCMQRFKQGQPIKVQVFDTLEDLVKVHRL